MSGGLAAAFAIGAHYESTLDDAARRQGAHFTPPEIAQGLVRAALSFAPRRSVLRCCDPACGGGVFLVACAQALVDRGVAPADALGAVVGVDIDPGAVAASRAALISWAESHGVTLAEPHVVEGDGLLYDGGKFDVVVGNPPFQGQLASATTRSAERREELRAALGDAAGGYVDTAVLFLLAGRRMLRRGGVMCLIQPRSIMAADGAEPARAELRSSVVLRGAWLPRHRQFDADVDVCALIMSAEAPRPGESATIETFQIGDDRRAGNGDPTSRRPMTLAADADWSELAADADGVPVIDCWTVDGTVGDLATVTAGFRDEYYALLDATVEADTGPVRSLRAVSSGAIDPGLCRWGREPIRFGKRVWTAPRVDLDRLEATAPRIARWAEALAVPKVLVATQTKVIEVYVDEDGDAVPITPVVAVMPRDVDCLHRLAAAISAPPATAWMHRRRAGSGMSRHALRISASDVAALPLPADDDLWARLGRAWARGEGPSGVAADACAVYGLDPDAFIGWWTERWPKRMGLGSGA